MLHHRRTRDGQEGQILVLFTLVLIVILAAAALVIDVGMLRNDRQTLVNTMDSAALAGGTKLPVSGGVATTAANTLITSTINANFPGLPASNYTITYRCLVGVDGSSPPKPYISRDIPAVCDPSKSLGRAPVAADFIGAGPTRFTACNPTVNDVCNVVMVQGNATTPFTLGRVVGVNSGSTGTITSASCRGPCGSPPTVPVDLVVMIDRTASMSSDDVTATRDAVKAVLNAYDPNLQRVALGFLGPSSSLSTCGAPAVYANTTQPDSLTAPSIGGSSTSNVQTAANASTGAATTLVISKPTSTSSGNLLLAGITFSGGTTRTITPPVGWALIRRTDNAATLGTATYYKMAGSEPNTYTWSFSGGTRASGAILRFTGVNAADPIDLSSGNTGTNASVTANSITTTSDETTLVGFFGTNTGTTFTVPSGMTERADVRNTNATGPTIEVSTTSLSNSGASGNKVATAPASASAAYAAQLVALNPVPVDTYGTDPNDPAVLRSWIPVGLTGIGSTATGGYDEAYRNANGTLNTSSHIVSAINCFDAVGGTGTNLSTPIAMATKYLQLYGRPDVTWGIILETDGQPSYSNTGDPNNYTCAAANTAATAAKAAKIEVFTIGFGLDGNNNASCPDGSGAFSNKKATFLLAGMATQPSLDNQCTAAENADNDHFYCEPKTSDLTAVFSAVATQLANGKAHLIQLYPIPTLTAISPTTGTRNGGTTVTITGTSFSGATSVTFAGTNAQSFTVVNDTTITAKSPAGPNGTAADVRVTTPGGTTTAVAADQFTYN